MRTLLYLLCLLSLVLFTGCDHEIKPGPNGATDLQHGPLLAHLYIVEKDGFKFAVLLSDTGVAITQIKP